MCPPPLVSTPGLRGRGTSPGSPAGFLGSSGWGSHPLLLSCSSQKTPPTFLSRSSCPPSYAPKDSLSLEGALVWGGTAQELSRLPVPLPEWAGQTPSTPFPLLLEGPSHLPLLVSPASLLCLQGPTQGGRRVLGRQGASLGAHQAPWPEWVGQSSSTSLQLLPEDPFHLPLLISLASLLCSQDPGGLERALEGRFWPVSSAGSPPEWAW